MPTEITAAEYRSMGNKKSRKYRNEPITVDGIRFDSQAEAKRYGELQLQLSAGWISDLVLQPKFPLHVNGIKIGEYRGDFQYVDAETGATVIEDVKGYRNRTYLWKKKHMKAEYGITIVEVEA